MSSALVMEDIGLNIDLEGMCVSINLFVLYLHIRLCNAYPMRCSYTATARMLNFFLPLFSWVLLDEEMRLDVQRIWKRNMGRDDRCISDHGKEVISVMLSELEMFSNFCLAI